MPVNIRPRVYKRKKLGDVTKWILSEHRNGRTRHISIHDTEIQAIKAKKIYIGKSPEPRLFNDKNTKEIRDNLIRKNAIVLSSNWNKTVLI